MERVEILRDLRLGEFDVLIGVNLLREGLDLPEVSLVAILDADKEGFLRNDRSLTQTAGRAARNVNGLVIFYADVITGNPYETVTDLRATLSVLAAMPKPFHLCVNRLYLIPGTQLAARAKKKNNRLPAARFSAYARLFWLASRHRMFFVTIRRAGREQWWLCKRVATARGSRPVRLLTLAQVPATHEERRQLAFAIDDYACGRRCFIKLPPARRALAKHLARDLSNRHPHFFRQN